MVSCITLACGTGHDHDGLNIKTVAAGREQTKMQPSSKTRNEVENRREPVARSSRNGQHIFDI